MKEYKTEGELLKIPEKESKSWIGKNACVILKEGNHEISGVIEMSNIQCTPTRLCHQTSFGLE